MLVIDKADCIYRLDVSRFDQMREDPKARPLRQFAGERMRGAEAVVELLRRKPVRIVRTTFSILTFDQMGCFDTEAYERHQFGRFAASRPSSLAELPESTEVRTGVLDARYRFDDRGGRWTPSAILLRSIEDTSLGKISVRRL
jgi:hypothetical protein